MAYAICTVCRQMFGTAEVGLLTRTCPHGDGTLEWEDLEEELDEEVQTDSDNTDDEEDYNG